MHLSLALSLDHLLLPVVAAVGEDAAPPTACFDSRIGPGLCVRSVVPEGFDGEAGRCEGVQEDVEGECTIHNLIPEAQ